MYSPKKSFTNRHYVKKLDGEAFAIVSIAAVQYGRTPRLLKRDYCAVFFRALFCGSDVFVAMPNRTLGAKRSTLAQQAFLGDRGNQSTITREDEAARKTA
jgi:hypothetical protein